MAEVGDHIEVAAAKGAPNKQGVVAKSGSLLTVEWDDQHRSSSYPAPGALRIRKREATSANAP
jgi:hypothetical protein